MCDCLSAWVSEYMLCVPSVRARCFIAACKVTEGSDSALFPALYRAAYLDVSLLNTVHILNR